MTAVGDVQNDCRGKVVDVAWRIHVHVWIYGQQLDFSSVVGKDCEMPSLPPTPSIYTSSHSPKRTMHPPNQERHAMQNDPDFTQST